MLLLALLLPLWLLLCGSSPSPLKIELFCLLPSSLSLSREETLKLPTLLSPAQTSPHTHVQLMGGQPPECSHSPRQLPLLCVSSWRHYSYSYSWEKPANQLHSTPPPQLPFSNKPITKLYWPHLLSTFESIHFSSFLISWRSEVSKLCPWAKSSPLPVFLNNVLLEPSYVHSFVYCLWLLSCYNYRDEYLNHGDHMACKAKIYSLGLYRKVEGCLSSWEGGGGGERLFPLLSPHTVSTSALSIPVSTLQQEFTNMQIRWHQYLLKTIQRPHPSLQLQNSGICPVSTSLFMLQPHWSTFCSALTVCILLLWIHNPKSSI